MAKTSDLEHGRAGQINKTTLIPLGLVIVALTAAVGIGARVGTDREKLGKAVKAADTIIAHEKIIAHPGTALTLNWLRAQATEQKSATQKLNSKVDDIGTVVTRIEAKLDQ